MRFVRYVIPGRIQGTYPLDCGPFLDGHTQYMSTWRNGALLVVFSLLSSGRLKDFCNDSFGVGSELLQQLRIRRADLLDQGLRHLRVLSHEPTHVSHLSGGKLRCSSASTAESPRVLLPLLLLLLGELEEVSGGGLLCWLLGRGRICSGLLGLGLEGLLGRLRRRGQLSLEMIGDALEQDVINDGTCERLKK